jgi:hypothetical protein
MAEVVSSTAEYSLPPRPAIVHQRGTSLQPPKEPPSITEKPPAVTEAAFMDGSLRRLVDGEVSASGEIRGDIDEDLLDELGL